MKVFKQNQLFSKQKLIDHSIELLQSVKNDGPIQLCFSGGKDSIVTYHLAKLSGIEFDSYLTTTGMDIPELIQCTKKNYPDVKIIKHANFWKLLKKNGLPSIRFRWCCSEMKEHTVKGYNCLIIGIRAEESAKRKYYLETDIRRNTKTIYPILYWPEWAIWEYIEENKLPYPEKIYSIFDRTGCIVCPYRSKKAHDRYREIFPATYRMFEKTAKNWWEGKIEKGAIPLRSFEESMELWYLNYGKVRYWEPINKDEDE